MTTDMRDAHETARERDAAWTLAALDGGSPRTRTHAINPDTGEFTRLDQESDTMTDQPEPYDFHDEAERALLNDNLSKGWQAGLHALLAIDDTLTEIRDRLPEREVERTRPEPGDVAEEPDANAPIGEHHRLADLCQRHYCEHMHDPWPADITEEPPVGSQLTDREGDIWERREGGWALWWPDRSGWLADLYESALDPWPVVRGYAPLRPTTDEDRKRVGLPVDPAPADVDPDEALAKVLCSAFWGGPVMPSANNADWMNVARAARKHIGHEVQMGNARALADERARADKAEADVERLTRQGEARDEEARGDARTIGRLTRERNDLHARADDLHARAENAKADLARVTEERDTAERLANRNADTARDFEDRYETSHANFLAVSSDLDRVTKERDRLRDRVDELLRERQGFIRERGQA